MRDDNIVNLKQVRERINSERDPIGAVRGCVFAFIAALLLWGIGALIVWPLTRPQIELQAPTNYSVDDSVLRVSPGE